MVASEVVSERLTMNAPFCAAAVVMIGVAAGVLLWPPPPPGFELPPQPPSAITATAATHRTDPGRILWYRKSRRAFSSALPRPCLFMSFPSISISRMADVTLKRKYRLRPKPPEFSWSRFFIHVRETAVDETWSTMFLVIGPE